MRARRAAKFTIRRLNTGAPVVCCPRRTTITRRASCHPARCWLPVVLGGTVNTAFDTVAVYDPATNTWTPQPPLSDTSSCTPPRCCPTVGCLIAGGTNYAGWRFTKACLYDVNLVGWRRRPTVSAIAALAGCRAGAADRHTVRRRFGGSAGTTRDSATDYRCCNCGASTTSSRHGCAPALATRSPTSFASARVVGIRVAGHRDGLRQRRAGIASAEKPAGATTKSRSTLTATAVAAPSAPAPTAAGAALSAGPTGSALTSGAGLCHTCTRRCSGDQRYLDIWSHNTALDIDGNRVVGAATDGAGASLPFGFRGAALVANAVAVSPAPTRGTADIERLLADLTQ